MAKSTSTQLRTQMIFSITLIIALIAIVATATFSWFVNRNDNIVDRVKVEVTESLNLELVSDGASQDKISSNLTEDFYLKPLWGNGENFFLPIYSRQEVVEGSGVYDDLPTGEYEPFEDDIKKYAFIMEFMLSSSDYADLYLENSELNRTFVQKGRYSETRKSAYGDFSKDNIIGAIRVAIFEEDTLKMIWIPNTQIQLSKQNDGYDLIADGEVEGSYSFVNSDGSVYEIPTDEEKNGNVIMDGVTYVWGDITKENCPKVTQLFGKKKFKVVVWIDGSDRECENALVGGRISVNLCFDAREAA